MDLKNLTPTPPIPPIGFIRLPQLLTMFPFSRSTLYLLIQKGEFPAPIKLSTRVAAWNIEIIKSYIQQSK